MLEYKQVFDGFFAQYDAIEMQFTVSSYLKIEKRNRGLGGFELLETPLEKPYVKDFNAHDEERAARWAQRWDLSNWAFFMAFDGQKAVGGATVAARTEGVNMLAGRDDLAVLWDIRVDSAYKGLGIGRKLFEMAAEWARGQGLRQMKIECQNNNVAACRFYHKMGASLCAVDEYAYFNDAECRDEAQFIWYLEL